MRGEIVRAEIRLDLDDAADAPDTADHVDQVLAEEVARDVDRVAVVERAAEPYGSLGGSPSASTTFFGATLRKLSSMRKRNSTVDVRAVGRIVTQPLLPRP